jgi:hypothetical protein
MNRINLLISGQVTLFHYREIESFMAAGYEKQQLLEVILGVATPHCQNPI